MNKKNEVEDMLLRLYIENLKKAVELIDTIFIPALREYDGKVINARLDNRIKDLLQSDDRKNQYYFDTCINQQKCIIHLNFYNQREVYNMECYWGTKELHRQVHYLPHGLDEITICWKYSDFNTYDSSKNEDFYKITEGNYFYIDKNYNTRLIADGAITAMIERKEELKKQAEELEYAITLHDGFDSNMIEAWQEETEKMHKKANELYKSIPSAVKDIYGIKCYANWQ